jgi:hypothetical protein
MIQTVCLYLCLESTIISSSAYQPYRDIGSTPQSLVSNVLEDTKYSGRSNVSV